jgi:selT/selW/selH-like putative selenoprotein
LNNALGVKAKLVPGRNGIFDVIADGKVVFSKFEAGRFPKVEEIIAKLRQ